MPDRILKESICTSDTLDRLTWFDEVFFYRLIVCCDDFGRYDARPMILKNRLFPLKDDLTTKAVEASLLRLTTVGLVMTYVCDGRPYLQLKTWGRYQRIRAKHSKFPAPVDGCGNPLSTDSKCRQMSPYSNANANAKCECGSDAREESPQPPTDPEFGRAMAHYQQVLGTCPSPIVIQDVKACLSGGMASDVICEAIDETARANPNRPAAYCRRILAAWQREGVRDAASLRAYKGRKPQGAPPGPDISDPNSYREEELPEWARKPVKS